MTAKAPSPAAPDLTGLLTQAGHVLTTMMTAALAEIDISPRGYCVLFHALREQQTQIQLAEVCDLDKTTMVVTLDELEKRGLAERRPSPADRRARVVAVTDAGARLVAEGERICARVHGDTLAALPEGEREVFVSALNRLVGGHLAKPVESGRQIRRSRQPRSRG